MKQRAQLHNLQEYLKNVSERQPSGMYFCRINEYTEEVKQFLLTYLREIKKQGITIERKLQNPDENQIQYYEDMVGLTFTLEKHFIHQALTTWMPMLSSSQCEELASAIFASLSELQAIGKNENIIKNVFIKYMCWLYYKFQRILQLTGKLSVPKVLYVGEISTYEVAMLGILVDAGCDVLLCNYGGEALYQKLDPTSKYCQYVAIAQGTPFPPDFSITALQQYLQEEAGLQTLYDPIKLKIPATNIWLSGDTMQDSLTPDLQRGSDTQTFYNMFLRLTGAEDKVSYESDLFHWKLELSKVGKTVFVLEKITPPTADEVSKVGIGNYSSLFQMINDLAKKIRCPFPELRNQTRKAFVDCIIQESKVEQENFHRLKSKAVYLVCWFTRYGKQLFTKEKEANLPVLLYFGTCKNTAETLLFQFFASLPVDVILVNPDKQQSCLLSDPRLFDQVYDQSLQLAKFPEKLEDVKYGTVAYHAEQDLTSMLYQDSGMYRDHQFKKASAITLKTMYEELYILWNQEVSMRPNFEVIEDQVVLPAIAAKVSGVKDADSSTYLKDIRKLLIEDTILLSDVPFYKPSKESFDGVHAIKNRKLQIASIVRNHNYPYRIYREEIQEYMLDKLQELLDSGIIKGTFDTGSEYRIISVIMDLDKQITRLIQKMDFTKRNPKLVLINTGEVEYSLEDTIVLCYLHFIGFDIAMFVPTGYRVIETYLTQPLFTEHQIGEFMYNVSLPGNMQGRNSNHIGKQENFFKRLLKNKV